jgi:5-(carboxyamino)imidazole ribonucleotide mutase
VATVALNAAKNAGILAAQIIGSFDEQVGQRMDMFKQDQTDDVQKKIEHLRSQGWQNGFDK